MDGGIGYFFLLKPLTEWKNWITYGQLYCFGESGGLRESVENTNDNMGSKKSWQGLNFPSSTLKKNYFIVVCPGWRFSITFYLVKLLLAQQMRDDLDSSLKQTGVLIRPYILIIQFFFSS